MLVRPSIDRVSASETADPADLLLVRRAQAGDLDAFGELVDRNRRAVFRAALAAVGSATEADDVAQDAFMTAFQKLGTFRGDSTFKTWLLTITWRKAIDRRKSLNRWVSQIVTGRRSADFSEPSDPVDLLPATEPSQEDAYLTTTRQRQLRKLIVALPREASRSAVDGMRRGLHVRPDCRDARHSCRDGEVAHLRGKTIAEAQACRRGVRA